ncbi:MAG: M48 family metalloprotease [Theionarchaea archaeon]|nr:M48 family metalloprotease [Theionarchaea archaeon]MBU7000052.1 M48 family metalloprotease [Theionarchaea archaeon]MBU7021650.1 M48 family metalloprotease [Theionarchaea archaeon]MBU7034702.1 M48 family metalloprotease [Theionarchaea archaeon]MBU7039363.1 M48 family metalloprotease [Theionarchaea archaeon]
MNEWQNLALAVTLIVVAQFTNEGIIALLKVRNATTRFRIRLISLLSCFFIFLFVPFKMVELTILSGEIPAGNASSSQIDNWVARSATMTSTYSGFARASVVLLVAAVVCFVVMLLFSKQIVARVFECEPATDSRLLTVVNNVSSELGVSIKQVMVCKKKCDAFVYGYPPFLAVGKDLLDVVNDSELRIIIRHELYHIKGRDTLLKPVLAALCIIFLYNPMSWFLYNRVFTDRECCADQASITCTQDTRTFLSLLLKFHSLACGAPCSLAVHWIGATNRIDSLLSAEKSRKIPVFLCLFFTFSSLFVGGTQLFGNQYVEINSSTPLDPEAYGPQADFSGYFYDIPVAEWYNKTISETEVSIPLQERDLRKLLSADELSRGEITIRMATLPLGRRPQFFGRNDIVDGNCNLIIELEDGRLFVSIRQSSGPGFTQKEAVLNGGPATPL